MIDLLITSRTEARKGGGERVTLKYIVAFGNTVFGNTLLVILVLANLTSQEKNSQTYITIY